MHMWAMENYAMHEYAHKVMRCTRVRPMRGDAYAVHDMMWKGLSMRYNAKRKWVCVCKAQSCCILRVYIDKTKAYCDELCRYVHGRIAPGN